MREIKFRAWDKEKKRMLLWDIYPDWIKDAIPNDAGDEWTERCLVMQYTGLKDKNGKEIYEGDIVTGGVGGDVKPQVIEWVNLIKWIGMTDGYVTRAIGFIFDEYYFTIPKCEVIGNIWENTELIDGK